MFGRRMTMGKVLGLVGLLLLVASCCLAYWVHRRYPPDEELYQGFRAARPSVPARHTRSQSLFLSPFTVAGTAAAEDAHLIVKERENGTLVADPYLKQSPIVRFATGTIGAWLDEKRSFVLGRGETLSCSVLMPPQAVLSFQALALGDGANARAVNIAIEESGEGGRAISLPTIMAPWYDRATFPGSAAPVSPRFPEILATSGWAPFSIDLSAWAGKTVTLRFALADTRASSVLLLGEPAIHGNPDSAKRYNVLHVLFDAMATKYMGVYNPGSKLTPEFDRLSSEFIVFDRMYSGSTKTRISVSSLFTGVPAPATGHGYSFNVITDNEKKIFYADAALSTLPRKLSSEGYFTMQIGNCGFTHPMLPTAVDYGFDASFEFQAIPHDSSGIVWNLMRRLRENADRPFYGYVHLNTTHMPRITPLRHYVRGFLRMPSHVWRPNVTGSVAQADDLFANLVAFLKDEGLWDNTIVVVSSDHGTLFERTNYGRHSLQEDHIKIPFMVHLPTELKQRFAQVPARTSALSVLWHVAPSLLDLLDLPAEPRFQGPSFVSAFTQPANSAVPPDAIFSYDTFGFSLLYGGRYKYVLLEYDSELEKVFRQRRFNFFGDGPAEAKEALYDLDRDPLEKNNIIDTLPALANEIRAKVRTGPAHPSLTLFTFLPDLGKSTTITVSTRGRLAYVDTSHFSNQDTFHVRDSTATIELAPGGGPRSFALRTVPEDAEISYAVTRDDVPLPDKNLVGGEYLLPILSNPGTIATSEDRRVLQSIRLYPVGALPEITRRPLLHISRVDVRRWVREASQQKDKGADTAMKDVLRSWGYIQ